MQTGKRLTLLCMCLFLAVPIVAAGQTPEETAAESAQTWLALLDRGAIQRSWEDASSFFKSQVTAEQWQASMGNVQSIFGGTVSRKQQSAVYARTLPGAPDGEYVVIVYESAFEAKAKARETVTVKKDPDNAWRVAGYYVK